MLQGFASLTEMMTKGSTIWGCRHLPQNRDIFMICGGDGTLSLYKYRYPDQRKLKVQYCLMNLSKSCTTTIYHEDLKKPCTLTIVNAVSTTTTPDVCSQAIILVAILCMVLSEFILGLVYCPKAFPAYHWTSTR